MALNVVLATVRTRFFDVQQISTEELQTLTQNKDEDAFLLVDVREADEHKISQISNAHCVTPNSDITSLTDFIRHKSIKKVIAYCSLGYRSCKLVQKLKSELSGSMDFYSLEGGIFKWANENRTLVDLLGHETTFVHPYNIVWGNFLEYERRKYSRDSICINDSSPPAKGI